LQKLLTTKSITTIILLLLTLRRAWRNGIG